MTFRIGVALITPFDEQGKIDFHCLAKLVERQIALGTEALICAGSTGEGSALEDSEWEELVGFVVAHVDGEIQVIANSGTASTLSSVKRTEIAKTAGADACMAITPYYCKPTFRGCKAHFSAICEVGLPVYLYYNPPRTGVRWSPVELAEIANLPGIVGVKDASGDLLFSEEWKKLSAKPLYIGNDDQLVSLMKRGAHGIISVIGNLLPKEVEEIVYASVEGDLEKAEELFAPLEAFFPILYKESNPQGIKAAMSLAGLSPSHLRLPLVEVREENLAEIHDYFERSFSSLSSGSPSS